MRRRFLNAKLHRATLTGARPDYEGSLSVDPELLAAAGIAAHEQVAVYDLANGARFETYAIAGTAGSRELQVNGAAARLVQPGDLVIVAAYCDLEPGEIPGHRPTVVLCGPGNAVREVRRASGGPA